jgi:hypothetical protein
MFGECRDEGKEVEVLLFGRERLELLDVELWIWGFQTRGRRVIVVAGAGTGGGGHFPGFVGGLGMFGMFGVGSWRFRGGRLYNAIMSPFGLLANHEDATFF